jgi:hypothetical protein
MPMHHLLYYVLVMVAIARGAGVEGAEPSLPPVAGLELWLDATRETAARDADRSSRLDAEG